ncbi:sun domain protein [Lasallia pustulata]|uniref:Sun domain protein n=1 Tax=Lasallia pustulata TaxID=136370 RepID=A0A1W5CZF4_9LECA|nr:sun domain protein [Lasallia pustulata]
MKIVELGSALVALLALHASIACAKHSNAHLNVLDRQHRHHRSVHTSKAEIGAGLELRGQDADIEKRGGQCQFPTNAGLVAVTPDQENAGWAMSPNQLCTPSSYCPYACPPGQVMAQWDPQATSYTYPLSMNGGLYCDNSGKIQKPFPDKPYCVDGMGNVGCTNKASGVVAFCQTVLPGNEAMLIPTSVETWSQLAVPGPSYWAGTSAEFYINPPGITTEKACVWGSSSNPYGNWSPYVAGANMDHTGNTYVKLAWNPIYLEPTTPFRNEMPTWGVEIVCDGPGCNGLPCAIDPATNTVNQMIGSNTNRAPNANSCVVTVPQGVNANFVVFEGGMSGAKGDSHIFQSSSAPPPPSSSTQPTTSSSTQPTTSSSTQPTTSSSNQPPSSTSTPTHTPTSTSTSSSSSSTMPSSTSTSSTFSTCSSTSSPQSSSSSSPTSLPAPTSSIIASASSTTTPSSTTRAPTSDSTTVVVASSTIEPAPTYVPAPHILAQNATNGGNATVALSAAAVSPQKTVAPSTGALVTTPAQFTGAGRSLRTGGASLALFVLAAFMIVVF